MGKRGGEVMPIYSYRVLSATIGPIVLDTKVVNFKIVETVDF